MNSAQVDDARAPAVQWHPEMLPGSPIFEWLVTAASHEHAVQGRGRSTCP